MFHNFFIFYISTFDQIMIMSKEMFKKMVKEKVIKKSFEILTKIQATHSKAKNIVYNPGPHTVGA